MATTNTVAGGDEKLALSVREVGRELSSCFEGDVRLLADETRDVVKDIQFVFEYRMRLRVSYTAIVEALYDLLLLPHEELNQIVPERMVFHALSMCGNHSFMKFIRIASKKNPNEQTRQWAESILLLFARGETPLPFCKWQKGAKRFIETA